MRLLGLLGLLGLLSILCALAACAPGWRLTGTTWGKELQEEPGEGELARRGPGVLVSIMYRPSVERREPQEP